MSCTRHFLNFQWEHHAWHPRVTFAETLVAHETTMWGGVERVRYVRCQKQDVCDVCGKTRDRVDCLCDAAEGDRCAVRLDWLDKSRREAE